ncbi:MAG TPA: LLM class F420-dependent oxidoreductase [Acidimicrobiales bacterium]
MSGGPGRLPALGVVLGMWQDRPPDESLTTAELADRLGFGELWIGEMATFDAFALATAIGARTRRIPLTVGPLAVAVRTPVTMAMGVATVAEVTGRTVGLALGTSSTLVVEGWHGRSRSRSARRLDETAQVVRALLAGERTDFAGETVRSHGFRLRLRPPATELTVAAFGPAAVRVAARRADRMVLTTVTPELVARYRTMLDDAAREANRRPPRLAVWLCAAVDPTPETREQLLRLKVGYLAAPGYRDVYRAAGYRDAVDLALTKPHPRDLLAALPTDMVDTFDLVGDAATLTRRLAAYRQAGADEVGLIPATAGDPGGRRTLEALAPAGPGRP